MDVETLSRRIRELVAERQSLRASGADRLTLERNRLQIAAAQRDLSYALIARHAPAAA